MTHLLVETPDVVRLLGERAFAASSRNGSLKGVSEALRIYEIREATA